MEIALIGLTIICAVGWLKRYIGTCALIYYMKTKGYKLPNDNDMKECTRFVVNHLFK